jgi:hypothetical protein
MKGKRVKSKRTGQLGTVTKVIGNCLWATMDDGTEWSGAKQYWTVVRASKPAKKANQGSK